MYELAIHKPSSPSVVYGNTDGSYTEIWPLIGEAIAGCLDCEEQDLSADAGNDIDVFHVLDIGQAITNGASLVARNSNGLIEVEQSIHSGILRKDGSRHEIDRCVYIPLTFERIFVVRHELAAGTTTFFGTITYMDCVDSTNIFGNTTYLDLEA